MLLVLLMVELALPGSSRAETKKMRTALSPDELAVLMAKGETLDYQKDIQPILDRRCAVCHSCYNSPCQLKMTSFEGVVRGATKTRIYHLRPRTESPTRLFIDAKTTEEWRRKKFADITGKDNGVGTDSFMLSA